MTSEPAESESPSLFQSILSIVGVTAGLLIFALILYLAYVPNRPGLVDAARIEQRELFLAQNEAEQVERANNYSWVNRQQGIVRIPIDQAMDLTVKEWQQRQGGEGTL